VTLPVPEDGGQVAAPRRIHVKPESRKAPSDLQHLVEGVDRAELGRAVDAHHGKDRAAFLPESGERRLQPRAVEAGLLHGSSIRLALPSPSRLMALCQE
jgi:hypothetical protein